jgi:hypothetical protein
VYSLDPLACEDPDVVVPDGLLYDGAEDVLAVEDPRVPDVVPLDTEAVRPVLLLEPMPLLIVVLSALPALLLTTLSLLTLVVVLSPCHLLPPCPGVTAMFP